MTLAELQHAIINTIVVASLSIGFALPIGTSFAILLIRTNLWGRQVAWVMLGSQLAVPLYVFAGGWSAGFGMQGWLTAFGVGPVAWLNASAVQGTTASLLAVGTLHALAAIPWVILIVSCGLSFTDRSQEEQALLDGGWLWVAKSVLLPKLRIWLLAATAICALPVLTEMVISNLYRVPTVVEQIYLDASQGTLSPLTYVASTLLSMLPMVGVLFIIAWRAPAWREVASKSNHFAAQPFELGPWRRSITLGVWFGVLLLVFLPIFSLIAKAGWQPYRNASDQTSYGWRLERFLTTCRESLVLFSDNFYWSGMLAVLATALALAISVSVGYFSNKTLKWGFSIGVLLLIAVPGPLVGLCVEWLLNRSTPAWLGTLYDHSLAAPVLAQQFRLLPLAWLMTLAIQASLSRSTREQMQLDGLSRWQALSQVTWPQTRGRWLVATLALLVLSVGELSCTILVLPPGVTTVSKRLFELLHFGMRHQDSGLCGILLLLGWVVSVGLYRVLNSSR